MDNIIEILLKIKNNNDIYISVLNEIINTRLLVECQLYKNGIPLIICDTIEKYKELYNLPTLQQTSYNLKNLNKIINQELIELCEHDYIIDYIDTDIEQSKQICYCSKCQCNFEMLIKPK